ncbi:MAG TPA: sulfite exporter TauE/SafE family protein [Stellaceae bacterium]|jgi:hypothetical protein
MAATSFAAALLQAANGFGFAVLAVPLFLLFTDPVPAVQLVVIVTLALSAVVLPGMRDEVDRPLLLRLGIGAAFGLPLGLAGFGYADPVTVRAVIGVTILGFAGAIVASRVRVRPMRVAMRPGRDLAAGVVSGIATALTGMSGPPVLIYLMLAGAAPRMVRATLFAFFAACYAATLGAYVATVGVPGAIWLTAASLVPFTWAGGLIGRRLGDRLGFKAATMLALVVLTATGLYTVAAAIRLTFW